MKPIRIGEWDVFPATNHIAQGHRSVRLEPKAMAVLLRLAERPGDVLTREALLAAAWPGVVVEDNALTQVIVKLRRAFGDVARESAYVEAIAKRGYRLVAKVGPIEAVPAPNARARLAPGLRPAVGPALALLIWVALISWSGTVPQDDLPSGRATAVAIGKASPEVHVVPFELIGDAHNTPAMAALARALAADLVTDLSKVKGLRVLASNAVEASKPADGPDRARYQLSGTAQQDGQRLRLNLTLRDLADGHAVWSERYEREMRDLFALQDAVVARVLEVLPVRVDREQTARIARRSTRSLDAWQFFAAAQAGLLARRPERNDEARALYWKAIERDPAFARAYAGLAMTHALAYQQGWASDGDAALDRALDRALEFAQTAQRLRPDLPEARWVAAFVATQRRQHAEALRLLDEATTLNPSYADAYALEGGIRTYIGQAAQALPLLRDAMRLNPEAGSLYFLLLGRAYYFVGDVEQAGFNLTRALERNPESVEARVYLALTLMLAGQRDEAQWQVVEIRQLDPTFASERWLATYPLVDTALRERLRDATRSVGL
jgi:adenylate cyclase